MQLTINPPHTLPNFLQFFWYWSLICSLDLCGPSSLFVHISDQGIRRLPSTLHVVAKHISWASVTLSSAKALQPWRWCIVAWFRSSWMIPCVRCTTYCIDLIRIMFLVQHFCYAFFASKGTGLIKWAEKDKTQLLQQLLRWNGMY